MSVLDNITKMSGSWFNDEDGGINILREKKRDRSPIRKQKSYYNDSYPLNNKFKNNLKEKQNNKKIFYIGDNDNVNTNTNIIHNEPRDENTENLFYNKINEKYDLPLFDYENYENYENYKNTEDKNKFKNKDLDYPYKDDINEEIENIYKYIYDNISNKIKYIYNYYCKIE